MSRQVVVFDTDPGIDDALALEYLLASGVWDLRAITVVAGNVPLRKTFANARGLATLLGIENEVPVYAGCPKPLTRELSTAEHVHGVDGMGGVSLPEPGVEQRSEHAVHVLDELSHRYAGELTIIAIGPLTNIAAALILDPSFARRVRHVVCMGGAFEVPGNIPPSRVAEANIYNDPEAARVVVESGIRYTMVGLDVTHQTLLTLEQVERLSEDTAPIRAARQMLDHYVSIYRELQGLEGCALHDPLAVAVAADPGWVRLAAGDLHVETASDLTRGKTVFVPRDGGSEEEGATGQVATALCREPFADHFLMALKQHWGEGSTSHTDSG